MADGAVSFLLEKLTTILVQNASLLGNCQEDIEEIKLELESMRSFLKDADQRQGKSELVETWVKQVREVAYQVENIVDEFMYFKDAGKHSRGIRYLVEFPGNVISRHRIASKLSRIKLKVHEVSERSKRYAFDAKVEENRSKVVPADWWHHHGESSIFDEEELVGMDENKEKLFFWLTEDEPRRTIVSIVGMGGLGKTTLVTRVYKNEMLKQVFDCWAWVSVSQTHGVEELLRSMIKEFLKGDQARISTNVALMNYRQLMEMLVDYLHTKRYLAVLDDVWNIDLWSRIRGAFPDNNCGSRIIFTTRNQNVATSVGRGSRIHRLGPLQESDAWTLFSKKSFWNESDHQCPPELEPLARVILRKCEGLPLAIVAIGGLLCSRSKLVVEWKKVLDSLNWQLSYNPMLERVKGILLLSFNDLPYFLKYCFLYCCVFHDGYLIKRKKLIRLWIAEGFIVERKGVTMEEVAEEYLGELILRCMIQVTETSDTGRVKTLRVHDVMRELALTTSEKENFCTTYDAHDSTHFKNIQRLSVHNRGAKFQLSRNTSRYLRSLFVFETDMCATFPLDICASSFKFLKVLDLQGAFIEKLPTTLFDLFNLSYLNLRKTRIKVLPGSIERLKNLQILDIRQTYVQKLPKGLMNLVKLRHLFISQSDDRAPCAFQVPTGISNLQSLQSLACIKAEEEIIQQIGFLTELKRLDIMMLGEKDGGKLCSSIQQMACLHRLSITAKHNEHLELDDLHLPPPFLQKLSLIGKLRKLPHWVGSLQNIAHLYLGSSCLLDDMLLDLKKIPNLVFLELNEAFKGDLLHFRDGGFLKLNKLKLLRLHELVGVDMDNGALPRLRELSLIHCQKLKVLPYGIEHVVSLQKLHLEEIPVELIQRLQSDEGDRAKVAHIGNITCVFQRGETRVVEVL
ncbi:antimicrobial response protein [Lithospermum erythrorhizon]|uniref:Antimicrobial response protein n=1 Tax=Lithospermum erythrorhizon TaxID=34254 RepID=A0AAV3P978_LITER